jgi:hypothetical protein
MIWSDQPPYTFVFEVFCARNKSRSKEEVRFSRMNLI